MPHTVYHLIILKIRARIIRARIIRAPIIRARIIRAHIKFALKVKISNSSKYHVLYKIFSPFIWKNPRSSQCH